MNFLVDTNVISALAPARETHTHVFSDWLDRESGRLFLSTVTAMEIRDGIAKARRKGATRKADALEHWWDTVEYLYSPRILPFDLKCAAIAGVMSDKARSAGHAPGFADIAIASIASANGLTILTRNLRHFAPVYELTVNPFEQLPD